MEFFPLSLGRPKPWAKREEAQEHDAPRMTYDAWREGLSGSEKEVDVHPAEDVLSRLIRDDPALPMRPWVVLGEPGAGKTSLLEHWHVTWLRALPQPCLGMRVPMLVRLRDVPREVLAGDPDTVADALWAMGLAAGKSNARGTRAAQVFDLPSHIFTPFWLLDGLDELATPIADSSLWDLLRALPREVVLTCRTAVFQSARAEIASRVGSQWHLLGLKPGEEQISFLAQAYIVEGMDPARAPGVVRVLHANSSLRPLAAIPLLLRLVAEAGPRLVLPATRAGFYEAATNALWERRLRDRPELLDLAPERDAALAGMAASMGLDTLEARPEALRRAGAASELREALRRSGLLHFDHRRGRISFPHLTFQEFHLARALLERPFGDVLRNHWADSRYEETLALLISLHAGEGRLGIIEAELRRFVAEAHADHASDPQRLWSLGRSPLRTALHLRARAAVLVDHSASPIPIIDAPVLMRIAIASDHRVPQAALAELARDPDLEVRRQVAGKDATPPVALAKLARDPDPEVRRTVAWNDATPPAALAKLARDPDPDVRRTVARTYATPPAVLAKLARDPDLEVRRWVAENGATPPTALAELMYDLDLEVRPGVARNYATPPATLVELARDPDPQVRQEVVNNGATPPAMLAELAREPRLRIGAGLNSAISPGTLVELARDPDPEVRRGAARNDPALAELARDPNPEVLAELARDPNPEVRRGVAANAAAPPATLAELAHDPDLEVRRWVAENGATPPVDLTELARHPDPEVRRGVAGNVATPPATLAELARDPDPDVRWTVAGNAAAPPATLAELARDPDPDVRRGVARNYATPPAALAELARDPDPDVRWGAALNAATLLEDLAIGM